MKGGGNWQEPSPEAGAHSQRLSSLIADRIAAAGGWLPFADYMELALYAPGLGYYAAGARKFGAAGDFVTAPELTPLFGQCLASQAAEVLDTVGGGILELGAGSGRLAVDVMRELDRLDRLPERYAILELSADLRQRQQALFAAEAPELLDRVAWLDT
ncbi:MAG: SAM-dependent methyltransferase, partial [Gallionellaceae bacterium]|nr:SAM-dependent methyltransferase [Gallionellaceae bacterium]